MKRLSMSKRRVPKFIEQVEKKHADKIKRQPFLIRLKICYYILKGVTK